MNYTAGTTSKFTVTEEEAGMRLDQFLVKKLPDASRSFLQKQIKDGHVLVNHKTMKAGGKLGTGDDIAISIEMPEELAVEAEDIPLDILFEDDDIIVINKPKQMVVHPAAGHYTGTVVNALLYHCRDSLSGINGVLRPGIVHRIDQDTTGAIVICKNDFSHRKIAEQLRVHSITRTYHAIVYNHFREEQGTVEGTIGRHPADRKKMAANVANGKHAVTHYTVLETLQKNFSYISCQLETGRTHQIRVHMAEIGHPVLGDAVYGPAKCPFHLTGQTLHAKTLGFIHPRTGKYIEFDAPLPEYFVKLLKQLS
ncbi:MAG: RluA family pseudouridine synthase [Clostridiaceae bacterium]|nr:RluA family pseudouridine synthase [Clostridiaceae bacterium]